MNEQIKSWAGMKSIHPKVYNFLQKYSDFSESGFIYVTEGGWERISDFLETYKSDEEKEKYVLSVLGEVGFAHFQSDIEIENLSVIDNILNGDHLDISENFDKNIALINEVVKKLNIEIDYIKKSWGSDFEETEEFSKWKTKINNSISFFRGISLELMTQFFVVGKSSGLPLEISDIEEI